MKSTLYLSYCRIVYWQTLSVHSCCPKHSASFHVLNRVDIRIEWHRQESLMYEEPRLISETSAYTSVAEARGSQNSTQSYWQLFSRPGHHSSSQCDTLSDDVQRYIYHSRISFNLRMSERTSKETTATTYWEEAYRAYWCRLKPNDAWTCRDAVVQCRCFTRLAACRANVTETYAGWYLRDSGRWPVRDQWVTLIAFGASPHHY